MRSEPNSIGRLHEVLVEDLPEASHYPIPQLVEGGRETTRDADDLFEEAREEHRVTSLVDELRREEDARRFVGSRMYQGRQRIGHRLLAHEEEREGALQLGAETLQAVRHRLPLHRVFGEVEVLGAPMLFLPPTIEIHRGSTRVQQPIHLEVDVVDVDVAHLGQSGALYALDHLGYLVSHHDPSWHLVRSAQLTGEPVVPALVAFRRNSASMKASMSPSRTA